MPDVEVRRGLVLGCGGTVGGAWQVGALAAVERELGWDARTAEVIVGTSGGASIGAMLGAGVAVEEMVAAQRGDAHVRPSVRRFFAATPAALPRPPVRPSTSLRLVAAGAARRDVVLAGSGLLPRGVTSTAFLDDLTDDLAGPDGWVAHPGVWLVACDARTGDVVPFGAPGAPAAQLRDAVRASWAIPGWFPPVTIGARRYIDGGVLSPTSASLLAHRDLDEIVVLAPMASLDDSRVPGLAGRLEGLLRRRMTDVLRDELARTDTPVRVVTPGRELVDLGPNFMDARRLRAGLDAGLAREVAR